MAQQRKPRNPFEKRLWKQIRGTGRAKYEPWPIEYAVAETRKYWPDFYMVKKNGQQFYIEGKGKFTTIDRKKMLLVKRQHPLVDIRFVFYRAKAKIRKGSQTTHAMWADKHGFKWADKSIPRDWIQE